MIGQTLAHYRINATIGAGGMGEVYRARESGSSCCRGWPKQRPWPCFRSREARAGPDDQPTNSYRTFMRS
jgi:hypothetical protein